jgi:hypothetical protein
LPDRVSSHQVIALTRFVTSGRTGVKMRGVGGEESRHTKGGPTGCWCSATPGTDRFETYKTGTVRGNLGRIESSTTTRKMRSCLSVQCLRMMWRVLVTSADVQTGATTLQNSSELITASAVRSSESDRKEIRKFHWRVPRQHRCNTQRDSNQQSHIQAGLKVPQSIIWGSARNPGINKYIDFLNTLKNSKYLSKYSYLKIFLFQRLVILE